MEVLAHSKTAWECSFAIVVAYNMYHESAKEVVAREAFGIMDDDKFEILDFH
jgi:hypothetical protein